MIRSTGCRFGDFVRRSGVLALGTALLLAAGCGGRPTVAPVSSESVVLAFGDSLTFGSGVGDEKSYPSVLGAILGCKVVNAGNPGELSSEGLARLPAVIEKHQPSLIVLCHGGNDFLRKVDEKQTEENMRRMVSLAKEKGVDVVLVGVPKPGLVLSSAGLYKNVAGDMELPYDGKSLPEILSKGSMKSDYVHPNEAGYRALAEAVAKLIRESAR